ncbi:hypothetical protein BJV82DRAFT_658631 [Fennellomyces sp. T-0311]|nr:hypothetical protein BJV82DRAFT_658631 [Fennellomyces sp. T-0311]
MDFTNLFASVDGNVGEALNNGNSTGAIGDITLPTSTSTNSNGSDDDNIAQFLMEAEAFLLGENTSNPFEIQQYNPAPPPPGPQPMEEQHQSTPLPQPVIQSELPVHSMISMFPANEVSKPPPPPPSSSRRQANKMREPIFVTEAPQNAYKKKKKARTPSSDDDDTDEDTAQLKKLTSKQRRQLRNKISARNFRVRRKEYIEQLEAQVDEQDKEINKLREANTQLEKVNQELFQELQYWRTMVPTPPATSSSASDSHSSPEVFPTLDLDQFSLFDFSSDAHIAHATIPDFDFSRVLQEKGAVPEDHERDSEGNIVLKPSEIIKVYPLFVPALMSMILRHTMTLQYAAYFSNTLDPLSGNKMFDLMSQQEWMQTLMPTQSALTTSGNNRRDGQKLEEVVDDDVPMPKEETDEEEEEDPEEREAIEKYMQQNYVRYAFYRACGFSHEQVYEKYKVCFRSQHCNGAKKSIKSRLPKLKRQARTLSAFASISNTVLHHPERLPLIASVLKQNQLTYFSEPQQKTIIGIQYVAHTSSTPSSSRKLSGLKSIRLGGRRD